MSNEITAGFTVNIANGTFADMIQRQKQLNQTAIGIAANALSVLADATKAVRGSSEKPSVKASTTAALPACTYANGTAGVGATLTGNSNGALAVQDGITLAANEYLLVKNQVAGLQNGLYKLTTVGDGGSAFVLTRVTGMDETGEFVGASIAVESGSTLGATNWTCTNASAPTLGTTTITFLQSAAGTAIPAGSLSIYGWMFCENLDATNYVEIGPVSGGVMVGNGKLKPGEFSWFRTRPGVSYAAFANTATVKLNYRWYED
jgi:hypothetical protein